jgi:hypothetical protein
MPDGELTGSRGVYRQILDAGSAHDVATEFQLGRRNVGLRMMLILAESDSAEKDVHKL